ncbi:MAG: S8 family serine peptidase, partial [Planctomycetota bacterium]|nr:S8 family serine peptidase [Planctomycetota bacterium]
QSCGDHGTHVARVHLCDTPRGSDFNLTGNANESGVVFNNNNRGVFDVEQLLTTSHNDGARIHNNSWGFDGQTNYHSSSRDIDAFTRDHEEDMVTVAVANSGAIAQVPENAKNCLAVSSTSDAPNQESQCFGTKGPTIDGRRKPEVLAPGCNSLAADINQPQCGINNRAGTSFAAPAVAALGVLARQYFIEGYYPSGAPTPVDSFVPSGALLRALLINSAVDMTGIAGYPNDFEGWGRTVADDAFFFASDARKLVVEDVWNASGLGPGDDPRTHQFEVLAASEPLKITLVWTDVPGVEGVSFTPTNNLDLEVTLPDQSTYLGNVFAAGESATGGTADPVNNVEQVHLSNPPSGVYTITVRATAIPVDTQGYALVVTGSVTAVTFSCESAMAGDTNNDGFVNFGDIADFSNAMKEFNGVFDTIAKCASDIGSACDACEPDGLIDANDLPGFVSLLVFGACQTIVKGDLDLDGTPDGQDIPKFLDHVFFFDGTIDTISECAADIGSPGFPCAPDGVLDENDVPGFTSILLDTDCQP